jgi:hypothetical protein
MGLASAAVIAFGGGAFALLRPGLRDGRLTPRGREVFVALGRGLLDGSLPAVEPERGQAIDGLLQRIDTLAGGLPPHAQSELSQLLALLGSGAGRVALAGLATDWERATVAEIQQALQGMRVSGVALRRQSYQALHDIVGSAFFSDPSTWSALGYPGPLKIGVQP